MTRSSVVTIHGNPLTLVGSLAGVGQTAPDFTALTHDLAPATLATFAGSVKVIASVPSLDTPVCDLEIKRFNKEATQVASDVKIVFISMDLPFAQKRFCQEFDIDRVATLSDHRDANFGTQYGVLINELRLLARAIFIIDRENRIRYVELVGELSSQPDYAAALAALKKLA